MEVNVVTSSQVTSRRQRGLRLILSAVLGSTIVTIDSLSTPVAATSFSAGAMVVEVDLSRGSGSKVLQFQLDGYGVVSVDWDVDDELSGAIASCVTTYGDGNRQIDLWDEQVKCDYPDTSSPVIHVAISGNMDPTESFTFRIVSGAEMVTHVVQWGNSLWSAEDINLEEAFQGAVNLTSVPSSIPIGVRKTRSMFRGASAFNADIGAWNTSQVTDMRSMFEEALAFNQDIGGWDTGAVGEMAFMFKKALAFNQDIGCWDTSSAWTFEGMFEEAEAFDQDIDYKAVGQCAGGTSAWDTGNVRDMAYMFKKALAFNHDIGGWDTSQVTRMRSMFEEAEAFNQDIGDWDTGEVEEMAFMFKKAEAFNQDIGGWDTSSAWTLEGMFEEASAFDQDIGDWDTRNVREMNYMFKRATAFSHGISGWNTDAAQRMSEMFNEMTLPVDVYTNLIFTWSSRTFLSDVANNGGFHGGFSNFDCSVTTEWQTLMVKVGSITDGGQVPCAPLTPEATGDATSATVSWAAPDGLAPTGYRVTASPGGASCTATASDTSCEVTGLTPSTAYTFSVVAMTANGDSVPVTTQFTTSAAPMAFAPAAPVAPEAPTTTTTTTMPKPNVPETTISPIPVVLPVTGRDNVMLAWVVLLLGVGGALAWGGRRCGRPVGR